MALTIADLALALNTQVDPAYTHMYRDYMSTFGKNITIKDKTVGDGGVEMRVVTGRALTAFNVGAIDGTYSPSNVAALAAYRNYIMRMWHMSSIDAPFEIDWVTELMVRGANQDDLNRMRAKALMDSEEAMAQNLDLGLITDRRGILGTMVYQGGITDQTTAPLKGTHVNGAAATGYFYFEAEFGIDAIPTAFVEGRQLHCCAAPTNYWTATGTKVTAFTPIAVIRNFHAPLIVTKVNRQYVTPSANGGTVRVTLAYPYTVATRSAIATLVGYTSDGVAPSVGTYGIHVGAPGTGDVITLWGGYFAGGSNGTFVTTAGSYAGPKGGPNYGLRGLGDIFPWSQFGSTFFYPNIETASGAVQYAIKDTGADRDLLLQTFDRNDTAFSFRNPMAFDEAGAKITGDMMDDLFYSLEMKYGSDSSLIPVMNSVLLKTLLASVGTAAIRENSELSTENAQRFAKWGFTGFSYQSPSRGPVGIGRWNGLPSCVSLALDPSDIELMVPYPAQFVPGGIGGILRAKPVSSTDTGSTLTYQGNRMRGAQVNFLGATIGGYLTNVKP